MSHSVIFPGQVKERKKEIVCPIFVKVKKFRMESIDSVLAYLHYGGFSVLHRHQRCILIAGGFPVLCGKGHAFSICGVFLWFGLWSIWD